MFSNIKKKSGIDMFPLGTPFHYLSRQCVVSDHHILGVSADYVDDNGVIHRIRISYGMMAVVLIANHLITSEEDVTIH